MYFVIVCALLPPGLFMQTAPRKYFRGAVTSAFFISSYLHFIFRHNLSCYFYLTVIYLKLPVIFNLKTGDIFIRKSKRGKDRLRYAIPSFAKNHISQGLIVTSNYFVAENGVTRRSRRFSAFIGCLCDDRLDVYKRQA